MSMYSVSAIRALLFNLGEMILIPAGMRYAELDGAHQRHGFRPQLVNSVGGGMLIMSFSAPEPPMTNMSERCSFTDLMFRLVFFIFVLLLCFGLLLVNSILFLLPIPSPSRSHRFGRQDRR